MKIRYAGIDPKRLIEWCSARGQKNIVLAASAVDSLPGTYRDFLLRFSRMSLEDSSNRHVVIPIEGVVDSMSFADLKDLQEALSVYRISRMESDGPTRIDPCSKCSGSGIVGGEECEACDGGGEITTLLEMSPEEASIAYGDAYGDA